MSESNRKSSLRSVLPPQSSPLTRAIHSEGSEWQDLNTRTFATAIGPDISVSTTFRAHAPSDLVALQQKLGELHSNSAVSSNHPDSLLANSVGSGHSSRSPLENRLAISLHAYRRLEAQIGITFAVFYVLTCITIFRYSNPVLAQTESTLGSILVRGSPFS
jgi:hypothetical protein